MSYLLNVLYLAALLAVAPWLLYKAVTTTKYRRGWLPKLLGTAWKRTGDAVCVWFHGVSVGEVHLLRQVLAAFRHRHPGWQCVVSTTTDTGFAEARKSFPDLPVFWWPLDFSWAVRRAVRRVRPDLVVVAEGELWPNFLTACQHAGIPVAVINGRLSPRTLRRHRACGWLSRRLFGQLALCLAQTEEFAAAYRRLGVAPERVCVTGSVKYDGVTSERHNPRTLALRELFGLTSTELVWVAGSTQPPEEEIVVGIYERLRLRHPELRLILVPRQQDRFEEVAAWLRKTRRPFVRRSALTTPVLQRDVILLVDTIGELGAIWGLADVAFVGGSLDGHRGGQNMIEPAAYGAAVLFGPHVWNFRDTANRLVAAGAAIQVPDAMRLEREVQRLLDSPALRSFLGTTARALVQQQQGATARTVEQLSRLLAGKARLAGAA